MPQLTQLRDNETLALIDLWLSQIRHSPFAREAIALTPYTAGTGDAACIRRGQTDRETAYLQSRAATTVGINVVGVAHITNRANVSVRNTEDWSLKFNRSSVYSMKHSI